MGLVTIALIIVGAWIGILVFVLAIFKASSHADANAERYPSERRGDMSDRSLAPRSNATLGDERNRRFARPRQRGSLQRKTF
jgi:hypothetical protein